MEELIKKLEGYENVVLHYECQNCNDEQVTYEIETVEIVNQLKEFGYIVLGLDCTECGCKTNILNVESVLFVEDML